MTNTHSTAANLQIRLLSEAISNTNQHISTTEDLIELRRAVRTMGIYRTGRAAQRAHADAQFLMRRIYRAYSSNPEIVGHLVATDRAITELSSAVSAPASGHGSRYIEGFA